MNLVTTMSAPSVNDDGVFYLDHNGKIVDFVGEGEGATNYAVVVGNKKNGTVDDGFNLTVDKYPQIKVINQKGDEVIYDIFVKLDKLGKVTSSAKYVATNGTVSDLFSGNKTVAGGIGFNANTINNMTVIKYRLNSDNKITRIESIGTQNVGSADTTKSSFKLATGALIVDTTNSESVNANKLKSLITNVNAVYNKKGEIEVLLVGATEIDTVKYTFAYITSVQSAVNKDGDEVLATVAYINGKKVDPMYTDADDVFTKLGNGKYDVKKVYALDVNGDVIEEANKVTTSGAIGTSTENVDVYTGTVDDRGTDTVKINGKWYTLSEDATIIGVDSANAVNAVRRLNSIAVGKTNVTLYIYDGYVSFVVIHE